MTSPKEIRSALVETLTKRWTLVESRDLRMLVEIALLREEITSSKAAELLGLSLEDIRVLLASWVKP